MDNKDFGRLVAEKRKALKLSQQELAAKAGVSRNYISLIERGIADNVSPRIAQSITTALGITDFDTPNASITPVESIVEPKEPGTKPVTVVDAEAWSKIKPSSPEEVLQRLADARLALDRLSYQFNLKGIKSASQFRESMLALSTARAKLEESASLLLTLDQELDAVGNENSNSERALDRAIELIPTIRNLVDGSLVIIENILA